MIISKAVNGFKQFFYRRKKLKISPPSSWKRIFLPSELNKAFYTGLEDRLIEADCGPAAKEIVILLRESAVAQKLVSRTEVIQLLTRILRGYFKAETFVLQPDTLTVCVMLGVNGTGKTTTIAKFAKLFSAQCPVVLGAADTFRAAAREQLEHWGKELGIPVIGQASGSDSASVAYDTIHSALAKKAGLALIDTAGRMQNKENLILQLQKLLRVCGKFAGQINLKKILVLDATVGQNGFEQAKQFGEKVGVDGIIITKTDTMAGGGIIISISRLLKLPVYFYCFGEKPEAIHVFDPDEYIKNLLV